MDRRGFLRRGAALGVASLVAGCLEGSATTGGDWDVGMTTRDFEPQELAVEAGTTVTWRNTDTHAHSVTAYADGIPADAAYFATGDFDSQPAAEAGYADGSGVLYTDQEFAHTFELPGVYSYFCIPHEKAGMTGVVRVGDTTGTGSGNTERRRAVRRRPRRRPRRR